MEESKIRKALKRYGPAVIGFGIGISGVVLLKGKNKDWTYIHAAPETLQKIVDNPTSGCIQWDELKIALFNSKVLEMKV